MKLISLTFTLSLKTQETVKRRHFDGDSHSHAYNLEEKSHHGTT